jgi:hypothetical protein
MKSETFQRNKINLIETENIAKLSSVSKVSKLKIFLKWKFRIKKK